MNTQTHNVLNVETFNEHLLDTEAFLSEKTEFDINYLSSRINSTMSATLYLKKLRNRTTTKIA